MIKMFKNSEKIKALQRDVESLIINNKHLRDIIEGVRYELFELKNPPKYNVGDKVKGGTICSVEIRRNLPLPSHGMIFWQYKAVIGNEIKVVE